MKRIFTTLAFFFVLWNVHSQTFNGVGGAIPDFPGGQQCFTINVTGLTGNLYSNYGLTSVTVNLTHPYDGDLEMVLISPNGIQTILSSNNGASGDNYTNTVFTMAAVTSITAGVPPFTGNFIPEQSFFAQNVGQNGNGVWQLCITDEVSGDIGALNNWSLTFGGGATGSADPGPNPVATDGCSGAPLICNLNGYTGSTYSSYTWTPANEPSGTNQPTPGPAGTFCGTNINNSSWIRFQASSANVSLGINIVNCTGSPSPLGERGIQLALYNACGSPWAYSPSSIPPNNSAGPAPNDENRPSCYGDGLYGNNTLNFNNLVVGNIYYIMFDGWNGHQCDYTITVNNGVQVVSITPTSNPICEGDTINLTASAPGTLNTFTWSSNPASTLPSTASVQVHPTQSTVYTVVASGICGSQTTSLPITVIPSGNPAWTAPAPTCTNTGLIDLTAQITGTSGGSWTGTGVAGSDFNPVALAPGNYNVTYTTGTAPCQKNQMHPIAVLATPNPQISVTGSTNLCTYQTTQLDVTSPVGGNITWSTGSNASSIQTNSSGNYWVSILNANGCSDADTQAVSIINYPQSNPVITPANGVICNGNPLTLGTTVLFTGYTWSTGGSVSTTNVTSAGSYSVITQDANGCLDTAITNVIASNINVNITGDSVLCPGENTLLTANGGYSFNWNNSATASAINVNSTGLYFVTATDVNGCTDSDSITVAASSITVNISGDNVLCTGEVTTLTATGGSSYLWNTTETGNTIDVSSPGTYIASSSNADGCTDADTAIVLNSIFNPGITGDTLICPGGSADLTASGGTAYLWNNSTTNANLVTPLTVTTAYSVTITNADGCSQTLSSTVYLYTDINSAPVVNSDGDTINSNQSVSIPVTNNDSISGGITILDSPSNGSATTNGGNIDYTPNQGFAGFDTLTYISCDAFCTALCDTATVIIKVNTVTLNFPEFISPNGDNSNDNWDVGDLSAYPENELTILNRWGDPLFHAQPYNNDWNGQSNMGIPAMQQGVTDGTYFFVFIPYPGDEPVKGFIEIRK